MKTVWSNKIDDILRHGYQLNEIGVSNWALKRDDALNALVKLAELQIPVLGGDVCEFIDGVVQYNYDSWYCEQVQGESKVNFVLRSIEKATAYVKDYRSKDSDKIFFAFIPGV